MNKALVAFPVLVAVLVGASSSLATHRDEPVPGESSIDQYLPALPGPDGNQTIGGSGGRDGKEGQLPADAAAQLGQMGATGGAIRVLAQTTAPDPSRLSASDQAGRELAPGDSAPSTFEPSGGDLDRVISTALGGGEGGMGWALPVILALTAVAALAVIGLRRQVRRPPPD